MYRAARDDPEHRYPAAALLAALLMAVLAAGPAVRASATAVAPAVVELFTSEGCSSCPPAEAVLGSLASRPDVLALAYHVTYWDSAAWRDLFGRHEAVSLQHHYVRTLRLPSAYTPQGVVNGTLDVLGSNEQGIEQAIQQLPRPALVIGKRSHAAWVIHLPALAADCPCTLRWVSVRAAAQVNVHGGENAGWTLREYRVVRSMQTAGSWDGSESERTLPLQGVPSDATSVVVLAESRQDASIVAVGEMAL